jgi:hypothetical protein
MLKLTIGGAKLEFLEEVGGFLSCFFGVVDRDLGGLLGWVRLFKISLFL